MDQELCSIKNIFFACVEEIAHVLQTYNAHVEKTSMNKNASGDTVDNLDMLTNKIFMDKLKATKGVKYIISEEEENIICGEDCEESKYMVCMDPLDGSSNIKNNITIGSIMAVYEYKENMSGKDIVFACFSLYGSATYVVYAEKGKVGIEVSQLKENNFVPIKVQHFVPNNSSIFAINMSNRNRWINPHLAPYIDKLVEGGSNMRWVASMVADVFRLLLTGGVFLYPRDTKSPMGRLRLLYEVNPMSFILTQAGGTEQDEDNVANLSKPIDFSKIHQKVSCILGSSFCVSLYSKTIIK